MELYHVSPKKNRKSIEKSGIEPMFSKGKTRHSWFVTNDRLLWALAHCSAKHGVSVAELDVWVVNDGKLRNKTRARYPGIFKTPCRSIPHARHDAQYYLSADEPEETERAK